jgi:hypothetical protein
MERSFLAWGGYVAAVALILPIACGRAFTATSSTGNDGGAEGSMADVALAPIEGTTEGGRDGAIPVEASVEGAVPVEAGIESSVPADVVYVSSTTGDDTNDGTDPALPKKSIAAALSRAQSLGAAASVDVCKGTYVETALTLVQSIPLRGAYDCASWVRTATYGYPIFDTTNATLIENGAPARQAATLVITGDLSMSAVIDGFVIAGATVSPTSTVGIEVVGSASPLIANDVVGGGGGNGGASSAGSVSVDILGGSPEVRFCVLSGGSGTGSPGSAGIAVVSTGSPYVHDDIISGGTGTPSSVTSDLASVGVLAQTSMTQATALKNLVVSGSDATGVNGSSAGIIVSGTGLTVDIEESAVRGGVGSSADTFSEGIAVDDSMGMTRIVNDRVYGGDRTGVSSQTYGVQVVQVGALSVSNSEIHAGTAASSTGASTMGVDVASAGTVTLAFDTIDAGQGGGAAISVGAGVSGVVVTDDLLAGAGPGIPSYAIEMGSCDGELADLDYTAFVNFYNLYTCPGDLAPASTIPLLATAVPGANTTGDIELQTSDDCIAATSCVVDPSCPAKPASCLPSIFGASWTADDGMTGLFDGAPTSAGAGVAEHGWSLLGASIPCALARGGTPVDGTDTDLFGQARDATKPTIGAAEYTSTICSN